MPAYRPSPRQPQKAGGHVGGVLQEKRPNKQTQKHKKKGKVDEVTPWSYVTAATIDGFSVSRATDVRCTVVATNGGEARIQMLQSSADTKWRAFGLSRLDAITMLWGPRSQTEIPERVVTLWRPLLSGRLSLCFGGESRQLGRTAIAK